MLYSCFFILAQLGGYYFLKCKKLTPSHIPLVMFSIQTLILYGAGFWGLLEECSYALTLIGCIMLIYTAVVGKLRPSAPTLGLTVFLVGLIWALIATMDAVSYTWSDMSHWMRYIKALLNDGGYPTVVMHPEISYSSYPPGSSLFISYFIPVLPMTYLSGKAIFAMKVLHFACLSAILSPLEFLCDRKKVGYVCTCLITMMILGLIPHTFTVMTDLLLGLYAASAVSMALYGIEKGKVSFASMLPVLCCLCLVKNSAVVFLFVAILFFAVSQHRLKEKRTTIIWQTAALLFIPLIIFASWVIFSRMAYPITEESMQTLSITRFKSILSSHESEFYKDLLGIYTLNFFSLNDRVLVIFWLFTFAAGGLLLLNRKSLSLHESQEVCTIYTLMCVCDAIYVASLLFSYMFTFTEVEAIGLASFARYFGSMVVVHIGVMSYLCIRILVQLPHATQKRGLKGFIVISTLVILLNQMYTFLWQGLETHEYFQNEHEPDEWYIRKLCSAVEDHLYQNEREQYVLWLIDRTGEPIIDETYNVTMYCRIALASYFCVPTDNVRVLDITLNNSKDVDFVLKAFTDRDNAVVVLTDNRPETLTAALELNIPILVQAEY